MLRKLLRALRTLSVAEAMELATAQAGLLGAQFLVATRPLGRLVSSEAPSSPLSRSEGAVGDATRLARSVNRAAAYGIFRPRCLVRAVALQRLLERRGIHGSRIRVGVRNAHGRFAAHAWVEYGSVVLGDHESHVSSFSRVADIQLVHDA